MHESSKWEPTCTFKNTILLMTLNLANYRVSVWGAILSRVTTVKSRMTTIPQEIYFTQKRPTEILFLVTQNTVCQPFASQYPFLETAVFLHFRDQITTHKNPVFSHSLTDLGIPFNRETGLPCIQILNNDEKNQVLKWCVLMIYIPLYYVWFVLTGPCR